MSESLTAVPPLRTIYFYITNSCNLHCAHCWLSMGDRVTQDSELSTGEIKHILDQCVPLGLESIKITGGEPWIRDDIPEIVSYAGALGLYSTIESNAMLMDEDSARALAQCAGLIHVAVSLDGATPASHAMLRGSVQSFHMAVRGIRHLVRHGVRVQIIASLHRHNVDGVEDLLALAAELGASSFKINPVVQWGRGQEMAQQGDLLSVAEVLDLNQCLDSGLGGNSGMRIHMTLPVAFCSLDAIKRQGLGSCGVMNLLGVLPSGELSICGIGDAHRNLIFGHALQTSIKEIWQASPGLARIRRQIAEWPTGLCQRCIMRSYCVWGSCRAEAHALLGSLSAPAPFCQASFDAGLFPAARLI